MSRPDSKELAEGAGEFAEEVRRTPTPRTWITVFEFRTSAPNAVLTVVRSLTLLF